MSSQEFSFAPDRRSIQGAAFQFSDQPSAQPGQPAYSQQDPLIWKLDNIYKTNFPNVNQDLRKRLVGILVPDVPLLHHNLDMIATSNLIVYHMRANNFTLNELTSEVLEWYFNNFTGTIISSIGAKSTEQQSQLRASFKATLLRYIIYVWNHTEPATTSIQ